MLDQGIQIAIWGTGLFARKFYQIEHKNYEVRCFYDNNREKWGQMLYGIPVKKWNGHDTPKIIIASSYWQEILEQLSEQGLRVFYDVIPFQFLHCKSIDYHVLKNIPGGMNSAYSLCKLKGTRKVAVIYGNCQTLKLREILLLNPSFADKYFFVTIPAICDYNAGKKARELWNTLLSHDEFWKQIDLFLYQKVNETNRFCCELATDHIVKKLSSDCQVVSIINIFFDGYFVQRIKNNYNIMQEIHQSGLFPSGDIFVNELLEKGFSEEDILEQIRDENFIASEIIEQASDESLSELKEREEDADIKISDYIELNYRKKQLFYSPNHPINTVLIEYARRIIRYLGLKDDEIREDIVYMKAGSLKGQDIPVYPSVIKTLGLKEYDRLYYINLYLEPELLVEFEEYIKKYLSCCF